MKPAEYSFDKEFQIHVNGFNYDVFVSGSMVRDEFSSNLYPTYSPDIEKIVISDEEGNNVNSFHEDYDDIMEEIDAMDFDEDYEEECFGYEAY